MKIVFYEAEDWERSACAGLVLAHEVVWSPMALDGRTTSDHSDAEVLSTFINSTPNAATLSLFPRLKLIATRSTGFDHIDLAYCRSHGVAVANVPDYGATTVAEHTFALLLALARHLVDAVERTRRGDFSEPGLRGFELRGLTLGVVGTGRIGRRVIDIAKGFGMDILAYDVRPDEAAAAQVGFRYCDLTALLASADIVTLHVPAKPETVGMLGDQEFARMKPGAVLVNTCRGSVVDVPALVRALADGRLKGAGLDVLPQEPLIREEAQIFRTKSAEGYDLKALVANHVLLRFPNVIVTPHIAYDTDSAIRRILETTVANIEAFAAGRPQNLVPTI